MAACKEKEQLTENYSKAIRAYAETVKSMVDLAKDIPAVEFDRLHIACENARRLSIAARELLHTHLAQHQCG